MKAIRIDSLWSWTATIILILVTGCTSPKHSPYPLGELTIYEYYHPPANQQPAIHLFLYGSGQFTLYYGVDSIRSMLNPGTIDTLSTLLYLLDRGNQEFLVPGECDVETLTRIRPDGIVSIQKSVGATDIPQPITALFEYFYTLSQRLILYHKNSINQAPV